MNKENKKADFVPQKDFLSLYCHGIYRLFGRKLLKNKKFHNFFYNKIYNEKYELFLKKANMKIMPEEYFLGINVSIFLSIFILIITTIIVFSFDPALGAVSFYLGVFILVGLGILLYNYPIVVSKRRGAEIDASIPYFLPYMKILSKELNLSKIIDIVDDFLIYKEIKTEFRKIKYYYQFLGYDIHSSIREAMISCPSRNLADLMNDLVTISNSGGDIYSYLDRKLDNLNEEIVAIEKKNIDTLLIFSQIYVVLLLISPLFFAIMSSILNLVQAGSDGGGGGGTIIMLIILLLALPFLYIAFMMLVFYTKPLYSRLPTIKND